MTHRFLDPRQYRPKASDIKALGMASRIRTLEKAALAIPSTGSLSPQDAAPFLARLHGYDADRLALVAHMLAKIGHVALLDSLHAQGLAFWTASDSVRLLLVYARIEDAPSSSAIWRFAEQRGAQSAYLRYAGSTKTLPISGWVWLGEQAQANPHAAIALLGVEACHTEHLSGCPHLDGAAEQYAYGEAVARVYRALLAVHTERPTPHPIATTVGSFPVYPFQPIITLEDACVAALAGWPIEALETRAHHLVHHFPQQHGARWAQMGSAHARLAFVADLHTLSASDRYGAIAAARGSDNEARFDSRAKLAIFSGHPVLQRLFVMVE